MQLCSHNGPSFWLTPDRNTTLVKQYRAKGANCVWFFSDRRVLPEHKGTKASFRNPSNEGAAVWLTLVPGGIDRFNSELKKWSTPIRRH